MHSTTSSSVTDPLHGVLGAKPITSATDVEALRILRNRCRDGFSTDNHEISAREQQDWWARMLGQVKGWLYIRTEPPHTVVGFGVLRQTPDGRWWSSVGVDPSGRGCGYGKAITADLIRRSARPVWATARLDNPAAMALHCKADWSEWTRDDKLAHYMTLPHVHVQARVDENTKYSDYLGWSAVGK